MKERHLLGLSGGKDSAALAVYMREKYPELPLEYIFIDSGCELPETYEFIERIEAVLNIEIIRIGGASRQDRKNFYWWLQIKKQYLPSPRDRWCTEVLKIKPYAQWIEKCCKGEIVHSYVGLRADEKRDRSGFAGGDLNIIQHKPFVEEGLEYEDIIKLLRDSGLGYPAYYEWRTRSGCFFCFFQTKSEWIGLFRNHPDLFLKASEMEKTTEDGEKFTWNEDISLSELLKKSEEIEANIENCTNVFNKPKNKLCDILNDPFCKSSCLGKNFVRGNDK